MLTRAPQQTPQHATANVFPGLLRCDTYITNRTLTFNERVALDISNPVLAMSPAVSFRVREALSDHIKQNGEKGIEIIDMKYAHTFEFLVYDGSEADKEAKIASGSGVRLGLSLHRHSDSHGHYLELYLQGDISSQAIIRLRENFNELGLKIKNIIESSE